MIGLPNMGNTCYINALIQCLRNLPTPLQYIKDDTPLISNFIQLLNMQYRPNHLTSLITELNRLPHFRRLRQGDSHELYLHLINAIYDKHTLHKSFQGRMASILTCLKCMKQNKQETPFLSLPLNITGTVQEAIQDFTSLEVLGSFTCEHCKRTCQHSKQMVLTEMPDILVLQRLNKTGRVHLSTYGKYRLKAICLHTGTFERGHYTAACREEDWVLYDDKRIRPIELPETSQYPYLLFYVK